MIYFPIGDWEKKSTKQGKILSIFEGSNVLRDYSTEVREALARGESAEARRLLAEAIALAEEKTVRLHVRIREFEEAGWALFPPRPHGDRAAADRD